MTTQRLRIVILCESSLRSQPLTTLSCVYVAGQRNHQARVWMAQGQCQAHHVAWPGCTPVQATTHLEPLCLGMLIFLRLHPLPQLAERSLLLLREGVLRRVCVSCAETSTVRETSTQGCRHTAPADACTGVRVWYNATPHAPHTPSKSVRMGRIWFTSARRHDSSSISCRTQQAGPPASEKPRLSYPTDTSAYTPAASCPGRTARLRSACPQHRHAPPTTRTTSANARAQAPRAAHHQQG